MPNSLSSAMDYSLKNKLKEKIQCKEKKRKEMQFPRTAADHREIHTQL